MLTVRCWGVRGSLPSPGPDTIIYGGNTSCLEIRADKRLIIVDLGTGIRSLGDWLMKNDYKKSGKIKADIFVTHTHWDHIMGFPMFKPIYVKGTKLRITAPALSKNDSVKTIIEKQLSHQYWPVSIDELAAHIEYNYLKEETQDMGGGLTVTGKFLNHSNFCMGYRFDYKGMSIVTVFDHEPFSSAKENEKIRQFIKGASIVIHDAQYTKKEYSDHIGWGHCSYDHVLQYAAGLGLKKLVFFHHEPSRTDCQLEQIEKKYAEKAAIDVIMAKEGLVLKAQRVNV